MDNPVDFLMNEIRVGDIIAYPQAQDGSALVSLARVVSWTTIQQDQYDQYLYWFNQRLEHDIARGCSQERIDHYISQHHPDVTNPIGTLTSITIEPLDSDDPLHSKCSITRRTKLTTASRYVLVV
jgi:hypothetical protein